MTEHNSMISDEKIARMLDNAVNLFHRTGLNELAEKWHKILRNYVRSKSRT